MLYTMWDNAPVVRSEDEPGPWFGYCGVKQEQNNLLLPFELSHSKARTPLLLWLFRNMFVHHLGPTLCSKYSQGTGCLLAQAATVQ